MERNFMKHADGKASVDSSLAQVPVLSSGVVMRCWDVVMVEIVSGKVVGYRVIAEGDLTSSGDSEPSLS